MMNLLRRDKEPAPMPIPPRPRVAQSLPAPAVRREPHQAAVQFAQSIIDLEEQVERLEATLREERLRFDVELRERTDRLRREAESWERQASLAEGECAQYKIKLAEVTHERDNLRDRNTAIMSRLTMFSRACLEILDEEGGIRQSNGSTAVKAPINFETLAQEVIAASTSPVEDPLPAVVVAGPRVEEEAHA